METRDDLAFILRSQPFQERDKLVTFLTENHGKINGIAKGAIHSRRYGGSLDLFTCSTIRYKNSPNSDLVRIEEANTKKDFLGLRNQLENLSAAGYFTDLVRRLTEDRHECRDIFLLLAHYFVMLESHTATYEIVRSFEIKLLEKLGWAPVLEQCVNCEEPFFGNELNPEDSQASLSVDRGGFLCHSCTGNVTGKIPLASLLWMIQARETQIQHTPTLHFPLEPMRESVHALQQFLRWHCPGLGNYQFQSHSLLESFLLQAREATHLKLPTLPVQT